MILKHYWSFLVTTLILGFAIAYLLGSALKMTDNFIIPAAIGLVVGSGLAYLVLQDEAESEDSDTEPII